MPLLPVDAPWPGLPLVSAASRLSKLSPFVTGAVNNLLLCGRGTLHTHVAAYIMHGCKRIVWSGSSTELWVTYVQVLGMFC